MFDHVVRGAGEFYYLIAVVVMPDHMHLILRSMPEYTLSRIMKGIKGASARRINLLRDSRGSIWRDESYDRIVRDSDELHQKIRYMYYNPFRANLVENPEEYPFWYFDENWADKMDDPVA